jgi:hypothetical protein
MISNYWVTSTLRSCSRTWGKAEDGLTATGAATRGAGDGAGVVAGGVVAGGVAGRGVVTRGVAGAAERGAAVERGAAALGADPPPPELAGAVMKSTVTKIVPFAPSTTPTPT